MEINPLQYPIGRFAAPEVITEEIRSEWIKILGEFPKKKRPTEKEVGQPVRLSTIYLIVIFIAMFVLKQP